ncbi:MAG: CHAT domain-containing tetratricopeptide repeat protein [Blastocatellia bacterium]
MILTKGFTAKAWCKAFFDLCLVVLFLASAQQTSPLTLPEGSLVARELSLSESDSFDFNLREQQMIELEVLAEDQKFKLRLTAPGGNTLREISHLRYGAMTYRFIATETGSHRIIIDSLEQNPVSRQYRIKINKISFPSLREKMRVQAGDDFYRAEALRFKWKNEDLRQALELYESAARRWQQFDWPDAITAWQCIGEVHCLQGDYKKALLAFTNALRLSRKANDVSHLLAQMNNIGYVHVYLGNITQAASLCEQVQTYLNRMTTEKSAEHKILEAQLYDNLGEVEYARGNLKPALSLFNKAAALWEDVGNRSCLATAWLNTGHCQIDAGNVAEATKKLELALKIARDVDDWRIEALSQTAQGNLYALFGNRHDALNAHHKARDLFRSIGDRQGEAITLNGLGDVYEGLNLKQEAIDCYAQALRLNLDIGNKSFAAVCSYYIGKVYRDQGDLPIAISYYRKSSALSRQSGKTRMWNLASTDMAVIYTRQNRFALALRLFNRSLAFYIKIGDLRRQALTLCNLGDLYRATLDNEYAIGKYRQANNIFHTIKDSQGESESLYRLAKLMLGAGQLKEALTEIERAISVIETGRGQILSQNWRSTYFASVRGHYELYVDILMQLSFQLPEGGFAEMALQVSERARARTLLDQLAETRSEIRLGVDRALLSREQHLQSQLSAKAAYQTRLLSTAHSDVEANETEREIRELAVEYDYVQSQIRAQSPCYRMLVQPQPLSFAGIQSVIKEDADNILLEYMLGDERSYVWLVRGDTLIVKQLPGRRELELMIKTVYEEFTSRQLRQGEKISHYQERVEQMEEQLCSHAAELSRVILGPVKSELGVGRLLVVYDGALQYIPFDVLPLPDSNCQNDGQTRRYTPVFTAFEVVHLQSISSLILLRQMKGETSGPAKAIAIWADPVYEFDDPRVQNKLVSLGGEATFENRFEHSLQTAPPVPQSRLLATQQEARNIMHLASGNDVRLCTGFAANRERTLSENLQDYSILHFATHGLVSTNHSLLSGLLLSTVNEQGRPQNGLLQLSDIYNLRLNADLVVLSACQTGLGEELNGEGFVGLTQGFLHAGARSIVVSLWKVDDKATELVMTAFYRAMLKDGLAPAAALRQSKIEIYNQTHHSSPYFWGSFVIQGEYRLPPRRSGKAFAVYLVSGVITLTAALLFVGCRLQKSRRRNRHHLVDA